MMLSAEPAVRPAPSRNCTYTQCSPGSAGEGPRQQGLPRLPGRPAEIRRVAQADLHRAAHIRAPFPLGVRILIGQPDGHLGGLRRRGAVVDEDGEDVGPRPEIQDVVDLPFAVGRDADADFPVAAAEDVLPMGRVAQKPVQRVLDAPVPGPEILPDDRAVPPRGVACLRDALPGSGAVGAGVGGQAVSRQVAGVPLGRGGQQVGPAVGREAVIQPGLVDPRVELQGRILLLGARAPDDQTQPTEHHQYPATRFRADIGGIEIL